MAKEKKVTPEETIEEVVENTEPTAEEKLTAELNETKDKLLRVMAEYDNFRKRSQKEKEMAYGDTKASTIAEFLPVYDNFIRAMSAEATDLDSFKKGIEMIFNQYGETFKKLGVEPFGEKGEEFDPNIHSNDIYSIVKCMFPHIKLDLQLSTYVRKSHEYTDITRHIFCLAWRSNH